MNADLFVAAFAKLFNGLQNFFHNSEKLFSTKRKTFFNEVKIFFQCSVKWFDKKREMGSSAIAKRSSLAVGKSNQFMHFSHFEKGINLRFRSA